MAVSTTSPRDQAYFDIFTTALEGGIGYWSQCSKYHWQMPEATDEASVFDSQDTLGFHAEVYDIQRLDEDQEDRTFQIGTGTLRDGAGKVAKFRIDRKVIARGVGVFTKKDWKPSSYFGHAANCLKNGKWDELDIDADIADHIVQAGLFGEAIYG